MSIHNKDILEARRKNNIFGEREDLLAIKFLNMGGTGLLYNTCADSIITFFGRGVTKSYIVHVLHRLSPDESVHLDITKKTQLRQIASTIDHVPLYVIRHDYSKKVKFYDLDDKKVSIIL